MKLSIQFDPKEMHLQDATIKHVKNQGPRGANRCGDQTDGQSNIVEVASRREKFPKNYGIAC